MDMILSDMIFEICFFFFSYSVELHFRAMHQNKHAFASSPVSAKERSYINTSPMAVKRKTHCPDRAEEPIKWTAFCFVPLQYWAAVLWELLLKFNTPGLAGAADPLWNRPFTWENRGHSFARVCVGVCNCWWGHWARGGHPLCTKTVPFTPVSRPLCLPIGVVAAHLPLPPSVSSLRRPPGGVALECLLRSTSPVPPGFKWLWWPGLFSAKLKASCSCCVWPAWDLSYLWNFSRLYRLELNHC